MKQGLRLRLKRLTLTLLVEVEQPGGQEVKWHHGKWHVVLNGDKEVAVNYEGKAAFMGLEPGEYAVTLRGRNGQFTVPEAQAQVVIPEDLSETLKWKIKPIRGAGATVAGQVVLDFEKQYHPEALNLVLIDRERRHDHMQARAKREDGYRFRFTGVYPSQWVLSAGARDLQQASKRLDVTEDLDDVRITLQRNRWLRIGDLPEWARDDAFAALLIVDLEGRPVMERQLAKIDERGVSLKPAHYVVSLMTGHREILAKLKDADDLQPGGFPIWYYSTVANVEQDFTVSAADVKLHVVTLTRADRTPDAPEKMPEGQGIMLYRENPDLKPALMPYGFVRLKKGEKLEFPVPKGKLYYGLTANMEREVLPQGVIDVTGDMVAPLDWQRNTEAPVEVRSLTARRAGWDGLQEVEGGE